MKNAYFKRITTTTTTKISNQIFKFIFYYFRLKNISVKKMDLAWTKSSEEVFKYFEVEEDKGLSEAQVKKYQEKYGPNG